MKISKTDLKRIIREEIEKSMSEALGEGIPDIPIGRTTRLGAAGVPDIPTQRISSGNKSKGIYKSEDDIAKKSEKVPVSDLLDKERYFYSDWPARLGAFHHRFGEVGRLDKEGEDVMIYDPDLGVYPTLVFQMQNGKRYLVGSVHVKKEN